MLMRRTGLILLTWVTFAFWACDSDGPSDPTPSVVTDTGAAVSADAVVADTAVAPEPDTTPVDVAPESAPAPLKTYTGGQCPTMTSGVNTFKSGSDDRKVTLFIPSDPKGASVTFLWYGFGDSMQNFSGAVGASQISKEANMIIVVPEAIIPVPLMGFASWGIHSFASPEQDLTFFDDLLACLEANFDINERVVYSMGFSAGALMTSMLIIERSEYLTAAALWSGGTEAASDGGVVTIPYKTPKHKLPVLAAHGGASDQWGGGPILVKFNEGTEDLANKLTEDGHPVVRCDHGLGHTIPQGGVTWAWHFLRTHYWAEAESQWIGHTGDPVPTYCTCPVAP